MQLGQMLYTIYTINILKIATVLLFLYCQFRYEKLIATTIALCYANKRLARL
jgi:hypothetical protein